MYVQSFVIFALVSSVIADDCPASDKSQLAPVRLRRHLLCDYDSNTRPIRDHKKAVSVVVQINVKYYNYDMHDNSFTIDSWMPLRWTDEYLTWNPDDYESIKSIKLSDSEIWMPDLSVYNRRTQGGDQSAISGAKCIISNEGRVVCVPSTSHTTICVSDLTKYPFDTHNCTVRFGSWVHSGEEIDFKVSSTGILTSDVVPNGEWELVDTAVFKHPGIYDCCPNNTYPSIYFSFKVKRISGAHSASIVLPAIALIVITLTALWIAPDKPERLTLCYVNVICEFLYLEYVWWIIPVNGDKIPLILLFARDSLLLSAFIVVCSVALKNMVESDKAAPGWISKLVCVLVAFKPGQIVFLTGSSFKSLNEEEDVTAIINSEDPKSLKTAWLLFAKIIDRLCFVIFLIVYVCMFIGFTP